jgi:hypothetical protein
METRLRGRLWNRWPYEVREDWRIVGREEWQGKVCNREEWKKLLTTGRNRRILHMPTEWKRNECSTSALPLCRPWELNQTISWITLKFLIVSKNSYNHYGNWSYTKILFWPTNSPKLWEVTESPVSDFPLLWNTNLTHLTMFAYSWKNDVWDVTDEFISIYIIVNSPKHTNVYWPIYQCNHECRHIHKVKVNQFHYRPMGPRGFWGG